MITLTIEIGDQSLTGLTFSIAETVVDEIHCLVGAKTSNNQIANTYYRNGSDKVNLFDTLAADFSSGLTISIYLQSDTATDIDMYSGLNMNIRDVTVKLLS